MLVIGGITIGGGRRALYLDLQSCLDALRPLAQCLRSSATMHPSYRPAHSHVQRIDQRIGEDCAGGACDGIAPRRQLLDLGLPSHSENCWRCRRVRRSVGGLAAAVDVTGCGVSRYIGVQRRYLMATTPDGAQGERRRDAGGCRMQRDGPEALKAHLQPALRRCIFPWQTRPEPGRGSKARSSQSHAPWAARRPVRGIPWTGACWHPTVLTCLASHSTIQRTMVVPRMMREVGQQRRGLHSHVLKLRQVGVKGSCNAVRESTCSGVWKPASSCHNTTESSRPRQLTRHRKLRLRPRPATWRTRRPSWRPTRPTRAYVIDANLLHAAGNAR